MTRWGTVLLGAELDLRDGGPSAADHALKERLLACLEQHLPVSDLRLIDSCITQLKAQGPSRTCNESKEEEVSVASRQMSSLIPGQIAST